jgi:hypothetical protein
VIERQRAEVLEQLFQIDISAPEEIRLLVRTVEAVRDLDARTAALVARERDRAALELRKLQLGRQGEKAYLAVRDESLKEDRP